MRVPPLLLVAALLLAACGGGGDSSSPSSLPPSSIQAPADPESSPARWTVEERAVLAELRESLLRMPKRELIAGVLAGERGRCALGVLLAERGIDPLWFTHNAQQTLFEALQTTPGLVAEVIQANDAMWDESPTERWVRVVHWLDEEV